MGVEIVGEVDFEVIEFVVGIDEILWCIGIFCGDFDFFW